MGRISAEQADIFNRLMPGNQSVGAGSAIKAVSDEVDEVDKNWKAQTPAIFEIAVTASAVVATPLVFSVPFAFTLRDIVVGIRAQQSGGNITLRRDTTTISNAIACAANNGVTRAGTLQAAGTSVAAGEELNLVTSHETVRAVVTLIGVRA